MSFRAIVAAAEFVNVVDILHLFSMVSRQKTQRMRHGERRFR
jgi:hypothetical protein